MSYDCKRQKFTPNFGLPIFSDVDILHGTQIPSESQTQSKIRL